ncbi:MAG: ABC transporter ATP-binding protein [Acetobacteraceae bacterium SCN 69-10]|nr:ABC transporter ATP-binding protein [Rhodospirillales bacterium]ODU56888.1 MAG: ABC transporter ATP-binding protein [Acetobacteraceae bacterium SCN 69-10]OJY76128.1 MAG: ABC transporter ATP-binding protein [Rhodospirillales bacterium 70-18]
MTGPTVALAGVTKAYGRQRAIAGIDLTVMPGERVALVGHNGAGKSTLMKLILGLIRPSEGRVELLGADPAGRAAGAARMAVGFLPENIAFSPSITGAELLAFYARLKRQPVSRNAALLERVGIAEAATRRVGTYSKGMRQRLGLAQALIGRPRVLLLDEPTTGLDPALRQSFYEILDALAADGASVLLASHALAELESRVDRVVVLNRGAKVADGTLATLRRFSPVSARIRLTLADPTDAAPPAIPGSVLAWTRIGGPVWETSCPDADKLALVRRLLAAPLELADIDVITPTLDEIYAGFLRHEAAV